jgi:hypothetical protein
MLSKTNVVKNREKLVYHGYNHELQDKTHQLVHTLITLCSNLLPNPAIHMSASSTPKYCTFLITIQQSLHFRLLHASIPAIIAQYYFSQGLCPQ